MKQLLGVIAMVILIAGCATAAEHRQAVYDPVGSELSVGAVQKEIHIGMSGADVIDALGAPNIVTTDTERRETWVYDRVATTYAYSHSNGGLAALILGWSSSLGGAVGPSYGNASGATSQSQKTLTVIIKFDGDARVRDFAYHASRF